MSDMVNNHFRTITDIIDNEDGPKPPIDISFFPNYMGINLCSVESMAWSRLEDGQLMQMTVYFKPDITGESE
jgi:hypothetical protein